MRKLYRFLIVVLICPVQTGYTADGESLSRFNGLQLAQYSAGDDSSLELSGLVACEESGQKKWQFVGGNEHMLGACQRYSFGPKIL